MKFWKILRKLLDEMFPEWQEEFISYKDLKQQLHHVITTKPSSRAPLDDDHHDRTRSNKRRRGDHHDNVLITEEMNDFVTLLDREINKFNTFFMDKEEEYIIKSKMLKDDVAEAQDSTQELMNVGRKLVDFHGEMILLENYTALNYTGLLKILKKYDKKSGDLIRLPFIQKVLHQPFFRTEVIKKLVKDCEIMIYRIFTRHQQLTPPEYTDQKEECTDQPEGTKKLRVPEELAEIKCMENMYLRLTISALRTLKEIRSGSSTINIFSLPPM